MNDRTKTRSGSIPLLNLVQYSVKEFFSSTVHDQNLQNLHSRELLRWLHFERNKTVSAVTGDHGKCYSCFYDVCGIFCQRWMARYAARKNELRYYSLTDTYQEEEWPNLRQNSDTFQLSFCIFIDSFTLTS